MRIKRGDVRGLLAKKRVKVDGVIVTEIAYPIGQFSHVVVDDTVLQARVPCYLMMNKPAGVVSATKDAHHTTVLDLLVDPPSVDLHIAGRLDFNSTGLLLLTNDGQWSRALSLPERNIEKTYTVTLAEPLDERYVDAFLNGMYFDYEGITTRPVKLEILSDYCARLRLVEGRYHQIKRMFGRFQNEVLTLHRHSVGPVELDLGLAPGQSRYLSSEEVFSLSLD
ncbi:16S rRNA pseudouridine(516) synthase [Zhongshania sp. BJYM1]|uniref:16S rRNA pseudouridine(516) synthase n=1 Tax=Zhongshania aquatica TaxID=2965069 RepID=UPI0022B5A395|nr:16S rRNA pseudouridine(516) synthase [Marortus sp. BJYM1]